MEKSKLTNDISNYKGQIISNNLEIVKRRQKIEKINKEIKERNTAIDQISDFFSKKRETLNSIDLSGKGIAAVNFVNNNLELYSVSEENGYVSKEMDIITYLQNNVNKLSEQIENLEHENGNLEGRISDCEDEISRIEREEK